MNILITGAGSGIGAAIARAFIAQGDSVIGIDLAFGDDSPAGMAQLLTLDISDSDAFAAALEEIDNGRPVDCLVNCAGVAIVGAFVEQDLPAWRKLVDINYLAPVVACKVLAPRMSKRDGGSIIQITSDSARAGAAGEAVYAGSKAALVAFSKSLAQELGQSNVRVNCVSPGVVRTPMSAPNAELLEKFARRVPLRRLAEPEDITGTVLFLASDAASYITGQVYSVNGGLTMVD